MRIPYRFELEYVDNSFEGIEGSGVIPGYCFSSFYHLRSKIALYVARGCEVTLKFYPVSEDDDGDVISGLDLECFRWEIV